MSQHAMNEPRRSLAATAALVCAVIILLGLMSMNATAQEWIKTASTLNQVSAVDETTAWGVNKNDEVYRTKDAGKTWQRVPGTLRQVSALSYDSAWGINGSRQIWRTNNGGKNWDNRPGRLKQVSAADYDVAWGVNDADEIWRTNNGGANWEKRPGLLNQISALSFDSAWGVNAAGQIWRTNNGGANWDNRPGQLKSVSAATYEEAAGVNAQDRIYRTRDGGATWQPVPGFLQQVSALSYDAAWGVNAGNDVFVRSAPAATAQAAAATNPAQVIQAVAVITPDCPDGQVEGKDGACIAAVHFYKQDGLSLNDARALSIEKGFTLATGYQLTQAFNQAGLDVYAYGRLDSGGFAVPVQRDHSNFKAGPNLGATGGNQGFFYVAGCPPQYARTENGQCRNNLVEGGVGVIGDITLGEHGTPKGYLVQTGFTTWLHQGLDRRGYESRYLETGRDLMSISLREIGGDHTLTIDLYKNKVSAQKGNTSWGYDLLAAKEAAERPLWVARAKEAEENARRAELTAALPQNQRNDAFVMEQEIASNYYNLTSPLSPADLNKVMVWIGKEASAATVDFCYRNSTPRPGYPWAHGDAPLPDMTGQISRCEAKYGAGNCETPIAVTYPKCSGGLYGGGKEGVYGDGPICWQQCPSAQQVMEHGQHTRVSCGIACASSNEVCAQKITDMVTAPIHMAAAIFTLGLSTAGKAAAKKAAAQGASVATGGALSSSVGVTKTALGNLKWEKLLRAIDASEEIFSNITDVKDKFEYALNNVENLETEIVRWNTEYDGNFSELTSYRIESIIDRQFPDPEDASYIKQKYGQYQLTAMMAADSVVAKQGEYKMGAQLESDSWRLWRATATFASFEPLGIVATIDAFAQPMCRTKAEPFPSVTILDKSRRGPPDRTTRSHL